MARVAELSPNQIVAYNLEKLRRERGWTAVETARRLGALLGKKISLASYSAMERSVEGRRVKSFDADEMFALARLFGVQVWLLLAPPINFRLHPVRVRSRGAPASQSLARNAATLLLGKMPEESFAILAARGAGEKPEPGEPLDPSDPIDAAALKLAEHVLMRPPPTSAGEEQKLGEEIISLLKEIHEARQKRPDMPSESESAQRQKRGRSKRR